MASKRKQGTFENIGQTVSDAAQATANAADEYVVRPVSKMLGLSSEKKKPAKRPAKKAKSRSVPAAAGRAANRPAKRPAKKSVKAKSSKK